ncbi:hypothetical protein Tco_0515928, partial [Tanacetum coccineum]
PTKDDQEKTNVADETKTDTSTPPVTAPITEATTITTSFLEITSFIALQLRVDV